MLATGSTKIASQAPERLRDAGSAGVTPANVGLLELCRLGVERAGSAMIRPAAWAPKPGLFAALCKASRISRAS